jgi:hypothetical protein
VELPKELDMVLKESYDISFLKLCDSPPTMLDIQHVKGLEQHVELHNPLPLTCGEKDEDSLDLLGYVQTNLLRLPIVFVPLHILNHIVFMVMNLESM